MKNGSYSVWSGRSPLVGDVCERANVTQPRALPFSQCHGPMK